MRKSSRNGRSSVKGRRNEGSSLKEQKEWRKQRETNAAVEGAIRKSSSNGIICGEEQQE